jgi:hypothetical protein
MENLTEKYYDLKGDTNRIIWEMKFYIFNHYRTIDFSNFSGQIVSGYNNNECIFSPEPIKLFDAYLANYDKVESVSNVVLDECDGDFTVTINGIEYWWILDDSVVELYDYIFKFKKGN